MHRPVLILILAALAACTSEPGSTGKPDAAAALLQADRDFAQLSRDTDPKTAFAAYLAPDAILLGPTGDPVEGLEAAVASFGEQAGFELHWQPEFAEVSAGADFGWTWGRYQLLVNGEKRYGGKYLNIWKRQPDGTWKVRLDMGNREPEQS